MTEKTLDATRVVDAPADRVFALLADPDRHPDLDASLFAPGHFALEGMSGLRAAANRPDHPLREPDLPQALADAEAFEISIEATPWGDVHRGWVLAQASLRYADAIYVAAAERRQTSLLTADARIERSRAPITCPIITVVPPGQAPDR